MLAKVTLWMVGAVMVTCWIGTLFEESRGRVRITIDDNSLFLGLSILLAGWAVAMILLSRPSVNRLASDYVKFASQIGHQTLTAEQLGEAVGEESTESYDVKNAVTVVRNLSYRQQRSLDLLIYEGKICLRDGSYSLPTLARSGQA